MTEWESGPLTADHDLTEFDCGVETLNRWLKEHAHRAMADGTARVYVWTAPDSPVVTAYYAVTPTLVVKAELTSAQAKGLREVPAYLLAKLALDQTLKGQGLGGELLFDALSLLVRAAETGGGRLIVVDAIDDNAASFYQHYGLKPVKGNPHRLVITVATVRGNFGLGTVRITSDSSMGLLSMVYNAPDGQTVPFVGDTTEGRRIARALEQVVAEREESDDASPIDLRAVIVTAIGRDPFAP